MITIGLIYCCEKVFILMNIWLIGKNSKKHPYHFYHPLDMEDITDAHYKHAKRVCKDFEIQNLGEYQDLYVQSDTLLLADVFENFRNTCINIYELDPAKFLPVARLVWQAVLKRIK